jgi:hypothetical protein
MASGDIVGHIIRVIPPATAYATPDLRPGGSSPAESWPVWDFDDTTAEYLDFLCYLGPNYAGGGITLSLPWSATSATSGAVVWQAAVRRVNASSEDIDTSQTYDYNAASASTAPGTCGQIIIPTIAFTSGADMDSWAAGELAIVRVGRLPTDGGDTMTGDAELHGLIIKET